MRVVQYGINMETTAQNTIQNVFGISMETMEENIATIPLFNKYASHPPVLVDPDGNFYGYFTADKYFSKRTTNKLALLIINNWEVIMEDVGEAYEKIFE